MLTIYWNMGLIKGRECWVTGRMEYCNDGIIGTCLFGDRRDYGCEPKV